MNRRVVLFTPASQVGRVRQEVEMLAPDLAGLTIPIAPNSSAAVVTHYAGEGVAPQAQIDALDSISPLTWAYVDEGSEGINYYPGFSAFAGAFNLVKWQDPNNGPLGN